MFVCLLYSFWFMPFLFYFFNFDLKHFVSCGFFLPLCLSPFGWLVKLTKLYSISAAFQDFILSPTNWSESINYSCSLCNASRVAYSLFPFSLLARNNIGIIMQKILPKELKSFLYSSSLLHCWELQKCHMSFWKTHPSGEQFKLKTFC